MGQEFQPIQIYDPSSRQIARVDSNGKLLTKTEVGFSGDIQIGAVEIKDATAATRANVSTTASGDNGLNVVPCQVHPLHPSQMNASLTLQYNASGDLIYVDKRVADVVYRKPVWKNNYTGSVTIDTSKAWSFGGYETL